jgi:ribosome recycling factor
MYQQIINKIKPELEKVIEHYKNELSKLRTGRASTSLVEDLEVDCYGQLMPLKQLATISLPEPRAILIQPWDKAVLSAIEKAIINSNLNLNPVVDGTSVRVQLPQMTEENRKSLVKILKEKMEEGRISIRHWRENAWEEIQEGFKKGEIREDDKFRGKEDLQKVIDEYNKKIEEVGEKKEKEIMTI